MINYANNTNRWYYSAAYWNLGDVMVANITFLGRLVDNQPNTPASISVCPSVQFLRFERNLGM